MPTPPPPRLGAKMAANRSAGLASGHGGRQGTFASAVQPRCPREPRTGESAGLRPASAPPLSRPGSKLRLSGRTALPQPNSGWTHARSSVGFSHSPFGRQRVQLEV